MAPRMEVLHKELREKLGALDNPYNPTTHPSPLFLFGYHGVYSMFICHIERTFLACLELGSADETQTCLRAFAFTDDVEVHADPKPIHAPLLY
jgi:hypothetical protein